MDSPPQRRPAQRGSQGKEEQDRRRQGPERHPTSGPAGTAPAPRRCPIDGACQPPTKSAAAVAAAPTLRKRKRNPETQVAISKSGSDRAGAPSLARSSSPPTACGSRGAYEPEPGGSARDGSGRASRGDPRPVESERRQPFVAAHSTPRDCKADLARHCEISRLKEEVTRRAVPDVAAVVGNRPLQEAVEVWPLGAKSLNLPVNSKHLMRGPVEYYSTREKTGPRSGATTCPGRAWTATPSPTSASPRTTCTRWQTEAAWMASLSSTLLGSPRPRGR
ncbi:unnamed protein product [Ectocarpus sp. 8 AP-2014]